MCVCVCRVPQYTCGDQRTTLVHSFYHGFWGLNSSHYSHSKCFYLLSHLTSPSYYTSDTQGKNNSQHNPVSTIYINITCNIIYNSLNKASETIYLIKRHVLWYFQVNVIKC